jgi:hypothetical protein
MPTSRSDRRAGASVDCCDAPGPPMLGVHAGGHLEARTATMRNARVAGLVMLPGLFLLQAPATGLAASFDCNANPLSQAQMVICQDPQLSRADSQTERRLIGLARRMGYGQYLGLLHWHHGWAERRDGCLADRACLSTSYRAQARFLDRLQQCLDNGLQRRGCLRNTLNIEQEVRRR